MTPSEFVDSIRKVLVEATSNAMIKAIESPPGRRPDSELLELSSWYHRQTDEDKAILNNIIHRTSDLVAFNALCIIDGVLAIEDIGEKGYLELTYIKDNQRLILNKPEGEFLHDIYKDEEA